MSKLIFLFPAAFYFLAASDDISTGGAFFGFLMVFWIIGLALSVLWLWMLIDCARRDFDKKTMWLVIMVLFPWIGPIVYFFAVKRKAVKPAAAPQ